MCVRVCVYAPICRCFWPFQSGSFLRLHPSSVPKSFVTISSPLTCFCSALSHVYFPQCGKFVVSFSRINEDIHPFCLFRPLRIDSVCILLCRVPAVEVGLTPAAAWVKYKCFQGPDRGNLHTVYAMDVFAHTYACLCVAGP